MSERSRKISIKEFFGQPDVLGNTDANADLLRALNHINTPDLAAREFWETVRQRAGGSLYTVAEQILHNNDQILHYSTPAGLAEYTQKGLSTAQARKEIDNNIKARQAENKKLAKAPNQDMPYSLWRLGNK